VIVHLWPVPFRNGIVRAAGQRPIDGSKQLIQIIPRQFQLTERRCVRQKFSANELQSSVRTFASLCHISRTAWSIVSILSYRSDLLIEQVPETRATCRSRIVRFGETSRTLLEMRSRWTFAG
jgi:hypothetical protein